MFLIVTQWMPLRPTADRFNGCFCLGSGPVFGLCWCCFAVCLVSAGETQVWLGDLRVVALCGGLGVVWFVLIDLLISRTYVLVQSFCCLLSCKDRALARHRPISRKKKELGRRKKKRETSLRQLLRISPRMGQTQGEQQSARAST